MKSNPGYLVITKNGVEGRTYSAKKMVNCKVPVYPAIKWETTPGTKKTPGVKIAIQWSESAILCDADTLKLVGYID